MSIDARGRERRLTRIVMIALAFTSGVVFEDTVVSGAEWHSTSAAFTSVRPAWIVPVLGMLTAAFLLRVPRWWSRFGDVVRALFVGYRSNAPLLPRVIALVAGSNPALRFATMPIRSTQQAARHVE